MYLSVISEIYEVVCRNQLSGGRLIFLLGLVIKPTLDESVDIAIGILRFIDLHGINVI